MKLGKGVGVEVFVNGWKKTSGSTLMRAGHTSDNLSQQGVDFKDAHSVGRR